MKIMFVAWDDKSFRERGLIIYLKDLARNLSKRGHSIYLFSSGHYDWKLHPYLKKTLHKELKQYELVNSPNLPLFHKGQPYHDISHTQIEIIFKRVLNEVKPDLVVFREFEGLCANLIMVAKRFNSTKTVCMLGNYSIICPEIELYNLVKKENCIDYDNGKNCVECNISSNDKVFLSRFFTFLFNKEKNFYIKARLLKDFSIKKIISIITKIKNEQNPITNPNQYRFRREEFVKIINNCDLLIAISKRQAEIFVNYGIDLDKIRVVSMAMSHQDKINFKPFSNNGTPITFGYIGRINKLKGCEILIQAFMKLQNDKQCRLLLFGTLNNDFYQKYRFILKSKNNNIFYKGYYTLTHLNYILKNIDIGIIPSIWEECYGHVGPEFLSASIPVIGSNIGGIPDYLIHKKNGFLFTPNDADDLASKMKTFVSNPDLILQMKGNIEHKPRYSGHIALMEKIFLDVCNNNIDGIERLNLTSWVQ